MIKSLVFAALTALCLQANAGTPAQDLAGSISRSLVNHSPAANLLPWTVGESADYNMDAGFIQGTVHMFVREQNDQGFWIQQDMDLGMLGKQKVEVLYDKNNGQVLQMLVNGEAQTPPDPSNTEIVETKNDHITVPKGEFDCMYVKLHDKKENTDSQAWITQVVPISGMLKSIAPSQFGDVTIELTDFVNL
jgi:hypothetical protein